MPATELGLADVGERLRFLCRRINTVTILHGGAVLLSVVAVTTALRLGLGPVRFSGTPLWLALAACGATLIWAVVYVQRNWVDAARAARMADRQGELRERITTLLELGPHASRNWLLPLLLTQTFDLAESWRPERLVPRSYPRSVYLAALAVLSMMASPLLEQTLPPLAVPPDSTTPQGQEASAADADPKPGEPSSMQLAAIDPDGAAPNQEGAQDKAGEGRQPASKPSTSQGAAKPIQGKLTGKPPPAGGKASAMLQSLPDSQRRNQPGTEGDASEGEGRAPNPGPQGDGERDDRKGTGKIDAPNPGLGPQALPKGKQEQQAERKPGSELPAVDAAMVPASAQSLKKDSSEENESKQEGSSPGAGSGSDAATMLTVHGGEADANAPAAGTFKLTLSSFLNAIEDKSPRQDRDSKRPSSASGGEGDAARPIHEQQIDDDALRKASIPAEYEEIVKRIYSRHLNP